MSQLTNGDPPRPRSNGATIIAPYDELDEDYNPPPPPPMLMETAPPRPSATVPNWVMAVVAAGAVFVGGFAVLLITIALGLLVYLAPWAG